MAASARGSLPRRPRKPATFFFANGLAPALAGIFATHPPLEERIRALEPQWDGEFIESKRPPIAETTPSTSHAPPPLPGGLGGMAGGVLAAAGYADAQMAAARRLHTQVPDVLRAELGDTAGASALVFALLLSSDADVRDSQFAEIAQFAPDFENAVRRVVDLVKTAPSRLTLADLAMPALRALSPEQYERFRRTLDALIAADQQVDLFEFTLTRLVRRHLDRHFGKSASPPLRFRHSAAVAPQITLVLSAFAHLGGGRCRGGVCARHGHDRRPRGWPASAAGGMWPRPHR